MINPPKAEDVEFFTQSGGVPEHHDRARRLGLDEPAPAQRAGLPGRDAPGHRGHRLRADGPPAPRRASGTALEAVANRVYSSPCGATSPPSAASARPSMRPGLRRARRASARTWSTGPRPSPAPTGTTPTGTAGRTAARTTCPAASVNFFDSWHGVPRPVGRRRDLRLEHQADRRRLGPGARSTRTGPSSNAIATVDTFCADLTARISRHPGTGLSATRASVLNTRDGSTTDGCSARSRWTRSRPATRASGTRGTISTSSPRSSSSPARC